MPQQSALSNRILSRLSAEDFARLADQLVAQDCARGMMFCDADQPIPFVHFLESGVASVVAVSPEGERVEAGIIGREGFVHPAIVLGADRIPHDVQTQLPGHSHRIAVAELLEAVEASKTLRRTLLLFAEAQAIQSTYTTLSNAVHQIEERLARWLLMCHDRSDSDDIPLTHEFMGVMLAVRRPSVTTTLHVLEGNGFLETSRGFVTIADRAGLEDFAGDAYGRPEAEYKRLLGPL